MSTFLLNVNSVANGLGQRHDVECHYILSKKRQATKKPVPSGPSQNSPKSEPKLNGLTSATKLAVEAPSHGQLSPGLTPPSHDNNINDLNDTVQNGSHSLSSSISDNISCVQSLVDGFSEDSTWSVDIDPEGILLPTTNVGNPLDLGKFSWPTSLTDSECQFGFDIPYTMDLHDAPTAPNTVTVTSGDASPYPTQPNQPFESFEPSVELIRLLDLNNKVRLYLFQLGNIVPTICADIIRSPRQRASWVNRLFSISEASN